MSFTFPPCIVRRIKLKESTIDELAYTEWKADRKKRDDEKLKKVQNAGS
jgi:hypothetical protein